MIDANVTEIRRGSAHRPVLRSAATPQRFATTSTGTTLMVIDGGATGRNGNRPAPRLWPTAA